MKYVLEWRKSSFLLNIEVQVGFNYFQTRVKAAYSRNEKGAIILKRKEVPQSKHNLVHIAVEFLSIRTLYPCIQTMNSIILKRGCVPFPDQYKI